MLFLRLLEEKVLNYKTKIRNVNLSTISEFSLLFQGLEKSTLKINIDHSFSS